MSKDRHITIDFETRSSTAIKYGAYRYSEDPRTEVMCIAVMLPDSPEVGIWHPAYPSQGLEEQGEHVLDALFEELAKGTLIEAHNVGFERAIWENVCVARMGWPAVKPSQWRCSAAAAASFSIPRSLDGASKALLGGDQNKDLLGHKTMMKLCKPRATLKADLEPIALRENMEWKNLQNVKTVFALRDKFPQHADLTEGMNPWKESAADLDILFNYCAQDVRVERAISDALPGGLSETELQVWQLDQEMNHGGVQIDMPLVDAAMSLAEKCKEQADEWIAAQTDGEVTSIGQRQKFLNWINAQPGKGSLDNAQKATIEYAVSKPDLWSAEALYALKLRQSVSKTSTKKYDTMAKAVCADSRVRGLLAYHGADTGRWAGRIVQPQNFPRGTVDESIETLCSDVLDSSKVDLDLIYGDTMEVLSSALRGAIVPSEGMDLLCADYSSIEARGLFWIVGDEKGLDVFRKGRDIYKDMATTVYGCDYDHVTKDQRQMGKQAILGLGYQMGVERFQETCNQYNMGVSYEDANNVVAAYRDLHAPVKSFWYHIRDCVIEALERGKQNGTDPVVASAGKLKIWHDVSDFLFIQLPSGRKLSFYKPEMKSLPSRFVAFDADGNPLPPKMENKITFMGVNSMSRKYSRLDTYGGKLCENIVQAVSRDVMAEAMLRCRGTIYKPVLTVHDEIVCEVPEGEGSVEEFENLISEVPEWAQGFPLTAEGWRGKRYRK